MTSDSPNSSNLSTIDTDRCAPRIRLKPTDASPGYVDGGWWPRSLDPDVEFPALIALLSAERGPVSRMAYNLATWGAAARRLHDGDRIVRCGGFTALDPHTVTVTGRDWRRITLLVVAPDTDADTAHAALTSASTQDNIATTEELLAG